MAESDYPPAVWLAAKEIAVTGAFTRLAIEKDVEEIAAIIWSHVQSAAVGWKQ